MDWEIDVETAESLRSPSRVYHDDGSALYYVVHIRNNGWEAMFEGSTLKVGTLEECLAACKDSEMNAVLE
jgi:hypothetical protein